MNLRNTEPIAQKVSQVIQGQSTPNGASGPTPKWCWMKKSEGVGPVLDAVKSLLDNGFGPESLVVLCGDAAMVTNLRSHTVGNFSFGAWKSKGIAVETVNRFKGLESEALVLVLADEDIYGLQVSGYVGMSRARSVLVVLGSKGQQEQLHWITSGVESRYP